MDGGGGRGETRKRETKDTALTERLLSPALPQDMQAAGAGSCRELTEAQDPVRTGAAAGPRWHGAVSIPRRP